MNIDFLPLKHIVLSLKLYLITLVCCVRSLYNLIESGIISELSMIV